MKEYIEKAELIAWCKEVAACDWNKKAAPVCWSEAYEQFADDVEERPSADVVEVVRCKDCKHWSEKDLHCTNPGGMCWCGAKAAKEGFCCFGERRADQ